MAQRVGSVDALRAFALIGIAVVNMPFLAGPLGLLPDRTVADMIAAFVIAWLFASKFFLIFAFLFGWGVGIQQASAVRAGRDFGPRFFRRQCGLLLIGAAHAVLVFVGDILVTYALIGLLLYLLRGADDRQLLRYALAGVAAGLASLALIAVVAGEATSLPIVSNPGYLGNFVDAVQARLFDLRYAFPFIVTFNGPLVFAAFCAGLVAARTGFLHRDHSLLVRLTAMRYRLLAAGALANLPFAAVATGMVAHPVAALASVVSLALAAPLLSLAYILIVARWADARDRSAWTAAGRMSLTGYVLEGVLGGLVFNGYGLGWFGQLGTAMVTLVAVGVFVAVEVLCALWARFAGTGPLERLLRAITYGASARDVRDAG